MEDKIREKYKTATTPKKYQHKDQVAKEITLELFGDLQNHYFPIVKRLVRKNSLKAAQKALQFARTGKSRHARIRLFSWHIRRSGL